MRSATIVANALCISTWASTFSFASATSKKDDPGLFHFVTRPDLKPPRWKVNIYHKELLSPGYWFVAPREPLGAEEVVGPWVGPAIYDGRGELIWSGAALFRNTMTDDFRVSNVGGQDLMTVLHQEKGQGVVVRPSYGVRNAIRFGDPRAINIHEFHFVDNGARALIIRSNKTRASTEDSQSVGIAGGCIAEFDGFEEFETSTWESVFRWNSFGRIGLNESSTDDGTAIETKCDSGWDFLHANSVDKDDAGNYYLSARFTDTVYKISRLDGNIIWRLGGSRSDFDMAGLKFSGQHSVRIIASNHTHTVLSILDNAIKDELQPTHPYSRGLLLSLRTNTTPTTVTTLAEYSHPHGVGAYAHARGNLQMLRDGNVFIGWSKQAVHSEHTSDGKLIMDAQLIPEWLGSYRNYKFPMVGRPHERIAVVARTTEDGTNVWVSWNGATEVTQWNCYKNERVASQEVRTLIASANKTSFETQLLIGEAVANITLEAVARNGTVLGNSAFVRVNRADQSGAGQSNGDAGRAESAIFSARRVSWLVRQHPSTFVLALVLSLLFMHVARRGRRLRWLSFRSLGQMNRSQPAMVEGASRQNLYI
ncbi:hypothetical protein CB0940_02728 [Cercospora beticola]|uniref:ASST-domain-containing protein n=1 Tax=Cercospora beticola TaxID=122368 RepID=A0A2G5I570_CERBT|nr:hypothetical protein CB0940_02728 [Cercospora beticola]PIA99930.1 hypothetical protein CB0940_02728 [Cercospora beticola]WPA99876.1 hypothetical protein RHO25_004496 [Cercospora beticola]CAK1361953.1 unnamed protein product [Cercospora beticola]